MKIQLGSGRDIREGYINTDIVDMVGIDKVLNVMFFPWPFEDNSADEILALDLIEHLPTHTNEYESTLIKFIEECHRILKPDGVLNIRTPSWHADFLWIDPEHVRGYDIRSMDFFDPTTDFGRATGFYTKVKFSVKATETENHNLVFEMLKI
jgi:predicted SAM-dependent methyltransferase